MIDNYTRIAIGLRLISTAIFLVILYKQIKLLKTQTAVQWVKIILLFLVITMLGNVILSLVVNFFRQDDGNLIPKVRHVSLILNSASGLAAAIALAVLYFREDE